MVESKKITSLEELFVYANAVHEGKEDFKQIEITDRLKSSLHVIGKSWDAKVDKRIASYVLSMQSTLDDIANEYAPDVKDKLPFIKIEMKEGSTIAECDLTEIIKAVIEKMDSGDILWSIAIALFCYTGKAMWNRYQERKEKKDCKQEETIAEIARQDTLRVVFDTLRKIVDDDPNRFASYERPIKNIVGKMTTGDSIKLDISTEAISFEDIKHCYPKRPTKNEEQTTYADGIYTIKSRNYDEGNIVLELEQENVLVKGYLWQLDETDLASFIDSLNHLEKTAELPFEMNLQINIIHTSKRIKYGIIIGEGLPRVGKKCVKLTDIIP